MGERSKMNNDFRMNWNWQLQLMDDIKEILRGQAMHIVDIEVATPEEDMKQATDMKIKITAGDVAVRIRRDIKWRELTIRAKYGDSKTEIHKLREGYGDWYLYVWTVGNKISEWIIVDINKMRKTGLLFEERPIKMNKDGYTGFVKYTIPELEDAGCIVAKAING